MTTHNDGEEGNLVPFPVRRAPSPPTSGDGMSKDEGKDFLIENLKDSSGFIAIVFDASGDPTTLWAGELDLVKSIGLLEIIKNELAYQASSGVQYSYDDGAWSEDN